MAAAVLVMPIPNRMEEVHSSVEGEVMSAVVEEEEELSEAEVEEVPVGGVRPRPTLHQLLE